MSSWEKVVKGSCVEGQILSFGECMEGVVVDPAFCGYLLVIAEALIDCLASDLPLLCLWFAVK